MFVCRPGGKIANGCGSKLAGDRRFEPLFPFTRVPFWVRIFDPQPNGRMPLQVLEKLRTASAAADGSEDGSESEAGSPALRSSARQSGKTFVETKIYPRSHVAMAPWQGVPPNKIFQVPSRCVSH